MKIAQIVIGFHREIGGYGRHVWLISEELRKRGFQVEILSTTFSPGGKFKKGEIIENGIKIRRFLTLPLGITPGVISYLIKNKFDVVHVHGYQSFQPFLTILAKSLKKFPIVFTPHFHPFGKKNIFIRKAFDFFFGKISFKFSDKVIALTNYEERLLEKVGVNKKKINIVPNPIKLSSLKGNAKEFLKRYKIDKKIVLCVSRIEKYKGIDILIKAMRGINATLVVVGSDIEGIIPQLKRIAKKNSVSTIFTGKISRKMLMNAYSACDLFVLPSRYEAFGIVFLEAMAFGKPVIGTNVGGIPEVVNGAGKIVKYGDVKSLSQAIREILENSKIRKKFEKEALRKVKEFDIVKVVNKLVKIYKEVKSFQFR